MRVLILLLLATITGHAELHVKVSDVQNNRGQIKLLVFRTKAGFPSNKKSAIYHAEKKAKKGQMVFKLPDLPAGEYAFTILHDENGNRKLDKNILGYPKEGIAISNYQKLARPVFTKAVVKNPRSSLKLKMLYP